jgi:ribosome maturation factor RimP
MSRFVEHSLDRETDDFELEVSSPGLTEDFRVKKQYVKNTGREVEVVTNDGTVLKGILKAAGEDSILVESKKHEIPEGEKKKHWITTENSIKYSNIKSAKAVIIF